MARSFDIGTTNVPATQFVRDESPDLPLFRITCDRAAPPHSQLGRIILTHDPGRALITGKCADVGSMLIQQFRGLTARAPYFANGSAHDLSQVVSFYDRRFTMGLTAQQQLDLVAFLSIL
jgi:cytochrome c peroxidase